MAGPPDTSAANSAEPTRRRIAYLGPEGTFAEEALRAQPDLAGEELVPLRTVLDIVNAVEDGTCSLGLIPLENSIEGSINVTLDSLAFDSELLIQREIDLPVVLHVAVQPGTTLVDITRVLSHANPLGQSRRWLHNKLPNAAVEATASTADAARQVARSQGAGVAAICTAVGAEANGLEIIASDVQDHADNQTRFVLIGRGIPAPSGHDKTSIVCFQREDRPGSLLAILSEFASRAINLTKLESRPAKRGLGQYCFFIDFEGHLADEIVADTLRSLSAKQAEVKFLGSYPLAGAHAERRRTVSKRWREANEWLERLRSQIRTSEADA